MGFDWIWGNIMIVLLDTNFITLPEQFHIDIFIEIPKIVANAQLKTIRAVINELKSLNTKAAKVGLQLIEEKKVEIIEKEGIADDLLIETADELNAVIATNDKELRRRALEKNVKIMLMRSKKKIEMHGGENLV